MIKKLVVLSVVLLFVIGAAGGCFNETPPNLDGTWNGTLTRSSNPTVLNFADVTIHLIQDQNNQFSGDVAVTYNPDTPNEVTLNATIVPNDSSTDVLKATIKANGVNDTGNNIVVFYENGSFSVPNGATFTFTFIIPHGYGCRGGDLSELTGVYTLNIGSNINSIDSGTVNLVKQ